MAPPRPDRARTRPPRSDRLEPSYWTRSRQPLQILVFLLPLVLAYELGLALLLRSDDGVLSNRAHVALLQFFDAFGIPASSTLFLGGVAIVVVLLVWHVLGREPWTVDLPTVGLMAAEVAVLTVPLLVLARLVDQAPLSAAAGGDVGMPAGFWARLAISIGAGLYEELMFRMLLIAVLHTILVDVMHAGHALGASIAVVVSAAAFTAYHPLTAVGVSPAGLILFYFAAGLYFGGVYVTRGFGIVVGVHALYDVFAVILA
ncbi:MAG: lysostaphin resistance A-like protein [Planctomycetota bacterium]|jgi:hypothetical protein